MIKKILSSIILVTFFINALGPIPNVEAAQGINLPVPGSMVNLSPAYEPTLIKGLTVNKDNPFLFDFVVDAGNNTSLKQDELKAESDRLIKYFFACLTIPEKDLWVNLSPYEKDKMVPEALGQTALGRDLLAEDYILKQLTASLIYPEKSLGKEFWNRVYTKAQERFGTSEVPVNTFNKVWILADKATVYEHNQTAFVMDGHLKVMLEEDYLAKEKNQASTKGNVASQIIREVIIPELEREVNTGKNFAALRQIFNSLILATWYKKNLKESLINQIYADKSTVKGVNLNDTSVKDNIYQQYLEAYKKGVFNYIKEDNSNGQLVPRKYFSGGFGVNQNNLVKVVRNDAAMASSLAKTFKSALFGVAIALAVNQASIAQVASNQFNSSSNTAVILAHSLEQAKQAEKEITEKLSSDKWDANFYLFGSAATLGAVLLIWRAAAKGKGPLMVFEDSGDGHDSAMTVMHYKNEMSHTAVVEQLSAIRAKAKAAGFKLEVGEGDAHLKVFIPNLHARKFVRYTKITAFTMYEGQLYIAHFEEDRKGETTFTVTDPTVGLVDKRSRQDIEPINLPPQVKREFQLDGFASALTKRDPAMRAPDTQSFKKGKLKPNTTIIINPTDQEILLSIPDGGSSEEDVSLTIKRSATKAELILETVGGRHNDPYIGHKITLYKAAQFSLNVYGVPLIITYAKDNTIRVQSVLASRDLSFQTSSDFTIDEAMLSEVSSSWAQLGIDKLLLNVLTSQDGLGRPYGLATTHTRNFIKSTDKSEIKAKLHYQITRLFRDNMNISRLVIDNNEEGVVNSTGEYVVSVATLDEPENLYYNKATGTSFVVYKKTGNALEIVTSVNIQWGSDVRVIISTEKGTFDYKLEEDGNLKPITPGGIQIEHNGSYISLGGNTSTWPDAMKAFFNERLSTLKTKERHAGSDVVDIYYSILNAGLMVGWVSLSEAKAIAHLMKNAKGLAKIQTANGLVNVDDFSIVEQDLINNKQYFIYAGVRNLVENAEAYINELPNKSTGIFQYKKNEKTVISSGKLEETLQKYIEDNLRILPSLNISAAERAYLDGRMKRIIARIVDAFLGEISLDKLQHHEGQREIIGKLQEELKGKEQEIFFDNNGALSIHSLEWILKNMPNQERKVGQNISGDQQKLLDFVFNQILKYVLRLEVHAIISEEDEDIIYGSGESASLTDSIRIVNFLDPIDGSSQISKGGAFGSIFTFGFLKKGQRIDDGTFDPRKQLLASFDLSFGPNISLTVVNPTNAKNTAEIVQFVLSNNEGKEEFRKEITFSNMLEHEVNDLTWSGLLPKSDSDAVLLLARGGSLEEAKVIGHRQFLQGLEKRYGVVSIYSGALASEMKHIFLANQVTSKKILGAAYFYASNKLRHLFEGLFYAQMASMLGGEAINGEQSLMNLPIKADAKTTLSAKATPFYAGSTWMTKLMMSWSFYLKKHLAQATVKPTEIELNEEWNKFIEFYESKTTRLIQNIVEHTGKTEAVVRKALLSYDGKNVEENNFPRFIEKPAIEVAKKLTFDTAMLSLDDNFWGNDFYIKNITAAVLNRRNINTFRDLTDITVAELQDLGVSDITISRLRDVLKQHNLFFLNENPLKLEQQAILKQLHFKPLTLTSDDQGWTGTLSFQGFAYDGELEKGNHVWFQVFSRQAGSVTEYLFRSNEKEPWRIHFKRVVKNGKVSFVNNDNTVMSSKDHYMRLRIYPTLTPELIKRLEGDAAMTIQDALKIIIDNNLSLDKRKQAVNFLSINAGIIDKSVIEALVDNTSAVNSKTLGTGNINDINITQQKIALELLNDLLNEQILDKNVLKEVMGDESLGYRWVNLNAMPVNDTADVNRGIEITVDGKTRMVRDYHSMAREVAIKIRKYISDDKAMKTTVSLDAKDIKDVPVGQQEELTVGVYGTYVQAIFETFQDGNEDVMLDVRKNPHAVGEEVIIASPEFGMPVTIAVKYLGNGNIRIENRSNRGAKISYSLAQIPEDRKHPTSWVDAKQYPDKSAFGPRTDYSGKDSDAAMSARDLTPKDHQIMTLLNMYMKPSGVNRDELANRITARTGFNARFELIDDFNFVKTDTQLLKLTPLPNNYSNFEVNQIDKLKLTTMGIIKVSFSNYDKVFYVFNQDSNIIVAFDAVKKSQDLKSGQSFAFSSSRHFNLQFKQEKSFSTDVIMGLSVEQHNGKAYLRVPQGITKSVGFKKGVFDIIALDKNKEYELEGNQQSNVIFIDGNPKVEITIDFPTATFSVKNVSKDSTIITVSFDAAMTQSAPWVQGGIDLNTTNMGLTITKDANGGVKVNFDPAMVERIKLKGVQSVVPVIINITPITDIRPLLGV